MTIMRVHHRRSLNVRLGPKVALTYRIRNVSQPYYRSRNARRRGGEYYRPCLLEVICARLKDYNRVQQ